MVTPFRLQPLRNLAEQNNDSAKRKLGQLNQQQQAAQNKLDTLLQFRRDYQDKFQDSVRQGMSPHDLRNFQDFINRLDDANTQQRGVMEQMQHSVQHGRDELSATQRKLKSFDTLAQRHYAEEKLQQDKAEQKLMDEHAGRQAAHRMGKQNDEN